MDVEVVFVLSAEASSVRASASGADLLAFPVLLATSDNFELLIGQFHAFVLDKRHDFLGRLELSHLIELIFCEVTDVQLALLLFSKEHQLAPTLPA